MVELNLTERQQEIFDFVKTLRGRSRLSADGSGHRQGHRPDLVLHGARAPREPGEARAARRDPTKPRAIEVLVDKAKAVAAANGLPLVGQVAAGQPILAEENIEEYVTVPPIAGGDDGEFVLRVKGDSMKNAGIFEDDYVVVRPQKTATNGEIVVAMLDGEATVKRFFKEKERVRLQPENDALEPIYARDVDIVGRVVGVCRRVS